MSDSTRANSSRDEKVPMEIFGLTGVTTGSSGEHMATTGASALGTSAGSGETGNANPMYQHSTAGVAPSKHQGTH